MRIDAGQWLCVDRIETSCTIGVTERERQSQQRLVSHGWKCWTAATALRLSRML